MENGTYVQIHYDPDNLDDVSVMNVEKPVSEPEDMPELEPVAEPESMSEPESVHTAEPSLGPEHTLISEPEPEIELELKDTQEVEQSTKSEPVFQSAVSEESKDTQKYEELQDSLRRFAEASEDIQSTLRRMEKKFTDEILNGENRDNSVKTIYKELNEYKAGIVEKALKNVLYDIVDIRETMLSQARFLREKKGENSISIEEFESYADDIGDILEKHDVTIYKGEIGEENIAVRQKIVRKAETEDDNLVKKVAESLSYGYEYGGKVLYPEKISVYVKKK